MEEKKDKGLIESKKFSYQNNLMRISLAASIRGKKFYNKNYSAIIDYLTNEGHLVYHTLSLSEEKLLDLTTSQRIKYFQDFYKYINKSDLLIAECSFPSINVAYEISFAVQQGKSVLVFHLKNKDGALLELRDPIFASESISIYEYTEKNLIDILKSALKYVQPQLDKRFTIIISSKIMTQLEKVSKEKKIPKAVYIRQLIEKDLLRSKRR